jgi:hypothetical protein
MKTELYHKKTEINYQGKVHTKIHSKHYQNQCNLIQHSKNLFISLIVVLDKRTMTITEGKCWIQY